MSNRAKYWARLVAAWKKSGLTQAEFCRRRGVKAVTFAWWKRELGGAAAPNRRRRRGRPTSGQRAAAGGTRRAGAKFAEVVLPGRVLTTGAARSVSPDTPATGYEIVVADGFLMRLPGNFDPEKVAQLIGLVAPPC